MSNRFPAHLLSEGSRGWLRYLCKGIEVGQVFKLGDKYSKAMSMDFLDEAGDKITPLMGCYGIGIGRTAASAVEQNNDKDGVSQCSVPCCLFHSSQTCNTGFRGYF